MFSKGEHKELIVLAACHHFSRLNCEFTFSQHQQDYKWRVRQQSLTKKSPDFSHTQGQEMMKLSDGVQARPKLSTNQSDV